MGLEELIAIQNRDDGLLGRAENQLCPSIWTFQQPPPNKKQDDEEFAVTAKQLIPSLDEACDFK